MAECSGCGAKYGTWPDLLVPDAVWRLIAPAEHDGGLLCPNCIHSRCESLGLKNVPCAFASGPLRSVEYVAGSRMVFLNVLWPSGIPDDARATVLTECMHCPAMIETRTGEQGVQDGIAAGWLVDSFDDLVCPVCTEARAEMLGDEG